MWERLFGTFDARVNEFSTFLLIYRAMSRYERTGEPWALDRAIIVLRQRLTIIAIDHPRRAVFLAALGEALGLRYERVSMELADLYESVSMARQAIAATPTNDPNRGAYLYSLGLALCLLGEQTQKLEDLAEAVSVARQAVAVAPADATNLAGLGNALQLMYERTQELTHLTEAVTVGRRAVEAIPVNDRNRARYLNNLGAALRLLSHRTAALEDLTETVTVARQAVAATPAKHPSWAINLANLGVALELLYEETYELALLTEAATVGRQAIAATPTEHPARALYLSNLGSVLWQLYRRIGELSFLTEAVSAQREAVEVTPESHPYRAGYISNLGITLQELSEQTPVPPGSHPYRAGYISNLGITPHELSEQTLALLTEVVSAQRDAVAATPTDHPEQARYLSALGMALLRLFDQNRELAALTEAVTVRRQAVAATPTDHADRAGYQNNLGMALWRLFEETNELTALREARDTLSDAANSPMAAVTVRINAGRGLAIACMSARDAPAALAALEAVVELIPQVTPRALKRSDREYGLSKLAGLSAQVAAAATAAGQPERAIELLEQTRGVLMGEAIDARSDLTELRNAAPELAAQFDDLRRQITASEDAEPSPTPLYERSIVGRDGPQEGHRRRATELAERRRSLAGEWTALLKRIRARAGFEQFLLPPSISRLYRQAVEGPLIIVYASRWRADALIIPDPAHPVQTVPLPGLTDTAAAEQASRLMAACTTADKASSKGDDTAWFQSQDEVHAVLGWLWDTITGPVLNHLNITGEPEPRSRIWWCPVGVLAFLPLHAAGHHTHTRCHPDIPRTVLDRAVSSYAITLRALEHARSHRDTPQAPVGSSVIIAMPTTPEAPELPGVTDEAQSLAPLLGTPLTLTGTKATYQTVAAALPHHQIAHFACHGLSDRANPAASRLLLYDHQDAPLTVAALMRLHLADAELAYLSACSTTQTNPALADEAMHLTAAVHLAGYRRVIGTLWPINDAAAARIATDVYTLLTNGGTQPARTETSAHALAEATRALRDEYPALPTQWAAHHHLGA